MRKRYPNEEMKKDYFRARGSLWKNFETKLKDEIFISHLF